MLWSLSFATTLLFGVQTAQAGEIPSSQLVVTIDGAPRGVQLTPDGKTLVADNVEIVTEEARITISAVLDPDPQIVFAITVVDMGAPSSFGFLLTQPITPTTAPSVVSSVLSGSTTAPDPAGITVTALPPFAGVPVDADAITEIMVFNLSQNGGISLSNAGIDLGPSFSGPQGSATYGGFLGGPIAGPSGSGSYDFMRVDVTFALTGGGDIFGATGCASVGSPGCIPAPEPGAALLLGLALGALTMRRKIA
jgi:hypothetical protein